MLSDYTMRKTIKNTALFSSQFIQIWNNKLILVSIYTDLIFFIDLDKNQVTEMLWCQNEKYIETLFRSFCRLDDDLILIPYNAEDFVKIDLNTKHVEDISGIIKNEEKVKAGKFLCGIKAGGYLWIIGENLRKVIGLDIQRNYVKAFEYDYSDLGEVFWSGSYIIHNNMIYIPGRRSNQILEIDIIKQNAKVRQISGLKDVSGFLDIVYLEDGIHLFDSAGLEYKWDPQYDLTEYLESNELEEFFLASRQSFVYKDKLFRVALFEDSLYIRSTGEKFCRVSVPCRQNNLGNNYTHFHDGYAVGRYFYIQSRDGRLFCLDMETAKVVEYPVYDTNDEIGELRRIAAGKMFNKMDIKEGIMENIEDLIDSLYQGQAANERKNFSKIGKIILEMIKFI